jgi:hypothetical protein
MKPINHYERVLEKFKLRYNYNHKKRGQIESYVSDEKVKQNNIIYHFVDELNKAIDIYLKEIEREHSLSEVYDSELNTSSSNSFLNNPLFFNTEAPLTLRFKLKNFNNDTDGDILIDSLIIALHEYKTKYSIFTDLEIEHDYDSRDNSRTSSLVGNWTESEVIALYRKDIVKSYKQITEYLNEVFLKEAENKKSKEYQEYLNLKKKFEPN